MRRAYKFRLRPTAKQHVALGQCLDAHRTLYNAGLQERRDAYEPVSYTHLDVYKRQRDDLAFNNRATWAGESAGRTRTNR